MVQVILASLSIFGNCNIKPFLSSLDWLNDCSNLGGKTEPLSVAVNRIQKRNICNRDLEKSMFWAAALKFRAPRNGQQLVQGGS